MKQLSGLDASFLYMETDTSFGHVNGLFIYGRPAEDFDPLATVRARFGLLVGELPPFRRRLVEVPFKLDHPYWIDDSDFDLDHHVRASILPEPGDMDQLAEHVARIAGRPLDRKRPLWEVHVIEGLADGNWAILSKVHHAAVDGAAGQMLLKAVHDLAPDAPPPPPAPWKAEPVPSDTTLISRAVGNMLLNPIRAAQTTSRLLTETFQKINPQQREHPALFGWGPATALGHLAEKDLQELAPAPATLAPATPWNKPISSHRRIAFAEASLADVRRLKDATDATVNDIVLAMCAGALRQYLLTHDALPDQPLRALVPVSTPKRHDEGDPWTNRVSAIFVDIPTDCAVPLERVERCKTAMLAAKRQHLLVPASALTDISQFSSPVLAEGASRLASQLQLADHVRPAVHLVISNVPRTRRTLYLAGAPLLKQYPVSTIVDGSGLNITAQSYRRSLFFGFTADRALVPDVAFMAQLHLDEIARLSEAIKAD